MILVFFQCTLKEKLPIFLINTLLLHILLLAITDRRNDRRRNELILVGLGNLRFLQVNRSIPSTHAERKNTYLSDKHSFTPYPSLSPYRQTEWQTERRIHSLRIGWRNFFSSCAVVSVFGSGGKMVLDLHTYVLRVQFSCGVVLVFWFWREIVFGVTYVLSVQYICAVVSVFWLWWEIVLKMRTRFYKKILLGYYIMIC